MRVFSITGQPSISLPLGETAAGIPVGVQVVGPPGRDDLVLAVAGQLERAVGFRPRREEACMSATAIDSARQMAFVGRLFGAAGGSLELATIYLGERLGLYRALADDGPLTSARARRCHRDRGARCARVAGGQAACGFIEVDDPALPAGEPRYALPPEHADVLLNRERMAYMAPMGASWRPPRP